MRSRVVELVRPGSKTTRSMRDYTPRHEKIVSMWADPLAAGVNDLGVRKSGGLNSFGSVTSDEYRRCNTAVITKEKEASEYGYWCLD